MRPFLMRQYNRLLRWWLQPAPAKITPGSKDDGRRPIPLEVGFFLHKDGKVYVRSRRGDGDRRVDSLDVKQLVYDEYAQILFLAKAKHAHQQRMRFLFRPRVRSSEHSS